MRTMYSNTLAAIASLLGANAEGNAEFTSISTDSRDCDSSALFVPLCGERFDGHDYITELCSSKRLAACLTQKKIDCANVPYVSCSDTLRALALIARDYRRRFTMPLIGVTGTNGKTTTKELICAALSPRYRCHKSEKNYNNEIGVPFALFDLREMHEYAVIEMGMNHSGEIDRIAAMALPDIAVVTNAAEGHLEYLGSVENVARAKAEIFNHLPSGAHVFINRDTKGWPILEAAAKAKGLSITSYGLSPESDIKPESYELGENHVSLSFGSVTYTVSLYGRHNVPNLLCAVAVGLHAGVSPQQMKAAFESFSTVGGRSEIVNGRVTLIKDTYNSNPLSLASALESAAEVFPQRRKIAVLADMKELGAESGTYHFEAGAKVLEAGFSALYVYGSDAAEIVRGAIAAGFSPENTGIFDSKEKLIASVRGALKDDDVILVKGSRSMKMEEVADALFR